MLQQLISEEDFAVLDGALGTQLQQKGFSLHETLWSASCIVENPQLIEDTHVEYYTSGADIVTTSSYQVSYEQFNVALGTSNDEVDEILRTSTQLAMRARELGNGGKGLVAASIGCYGAHLANGSEYSGLYGLTTSQLKDWHKRRFEVLASSGAHLLACETIPCLAEIKAELQLLGLHDIDSWISVACRSPTELNSGELIEDFLRLVEDSDFDTAHDSSYSVRKLAVGVNCTSPAYTEEIIQLMRDTCAKSRLIVAYPNEGSVWDDVINRHVPNTGYSDDQFANLAALWYDAGAHIIGGCCSTTPSTISSVKKSLTLHVHSRDS